MYSFEGFNMSIILISLLYFSIIAYIDKFLWSVI